VHRFATLGGTLTIRRKEELGLKREKIKQNALVEKPSSAMGLLSRKKLVTVPSQKEKSSEEKKKGTGLVRKKKKLRPER